MAADEPVPSADVAAQLAAADDMLANASALGDFTARQMEGKKAAEAYKAALVAWEDLIPEERAFKYIEYGDKVLEARCGAPSCILFFTALTELENSSGVTVSTLIPLCDRFARYNLLMQFGAMMVQRIVKELVTTDEESAQLWATLHGGWEPTQDDPTAFTRLAAKSAEYQKEGKYGLAQEFFTRAIAAAPSLTPEQRLQQFGVRAKSYEEAGEYRAAIVLRWNGITVWLRNLPQEHGSLAAPIILADQLNVDVAKLPPTPRFIVDTIREQVEPMIPLTEMAADDYGLGLDLILESLDRVRILEEVEAAEAAAAAEGGGEDGGEGGEGGEVADATPEAAE